MNLFINTNYKLPDNIINELFKIYGLEVNILQLNANNIYEIINDEKYNENDDCELINKINLFLTNKTLNMSSTDKQIINKLCLLYFQGGVFINSNIFINNFNYIKKVYLENDICMIKSCVNNSIFDGIIVCKKKNNRLLNIIERVIDISNIENIHSLILNNKNITLLNEQIITDKSNIYYNGEIIAEHFLNSITLLERFKVHKEIPKNKSNIKIGITIPVPENLNSLYSNGIRQNCLYFYELLNNMDYDVKLIIDSIEHISVLNSIDFYNFEYILEKNVFMYEFDVIFSMGFSFPNQILKGLKNMGVKNISYVCGNNYLIDSEKLLYNQHKKKSINAYDQSIYDQIWIIPQMYNQNKCYLEILTQTQCLQVPFIWSSMSIKLTSKILKLEDENSLMYSKKNSKIGIFEPNLSIMKWSLPCLLIAENTHNLYNNIEHIYITNLNKTENNTNDFNMKDYNSICKNLTLFKEKKISVESRYNTLEFMSKHCDIAISHQWENPLNYLYLDLAWMGWPILHNAHLCKDVGYYYEGFNYTEASEILNSILINHTSNINEYIKKNRKIIDGYLPTNKLLQNNYKNLITNIFNK